ncbi:MAG: flippase-like domain-containing protein [Chloroflexi bacterium]|nr:flippase-like domain-containing protein [Chloroflexota bacterium]
MPGPPPFSLRRRLLSLPTLASFVIAAVLLAVLASRFSIDVEKTWQTIRASHLPLYLLALGVHYTTFLFRGARWRLLLKNAGAEADSPLPSVGTAGRLILLGWFASSITWFRLGDVYRAYAYGEESGASLPRGVGTVLAERVMDVIVVFALLLVGFLLLLADPAHRPSGFLLVAGLGLIGAAGLFLLAMRLLRTPLAKRLPARLRQHYWTFHQGTMRSFGSLPVVMTLGLLGWFSEVGRLFFVVQATGLPVGMGLILFVSMAHAFFSSVPLTPGGLGVAEAGMAGLLALALRPEQALSVALLDRSISYLSTIFVGSIALLYHQRVVARRLWTGATLPATGASATTSESPSP